MEWKYQKASKRKYKGGKKFWKSSLKIFHPIFQAAEGESGREVTVVQCFRAL